jgi:general stress protein YciG
MKPTKLDVRMKSSGTHLRAIEPFSGCLRHRSKYDGRHDAILTLKCVREVLKRAQEQLSIAAALDNHTTAHHDQKIDRQALNQPFVQAINMTHNQNPGNFANRPEEEVQEIARKGGQSSHRGGFASMDPDKQGSLAVLHLISSYTYNGSSATSHQKAVTHPVALSSQVVRRQRKLATLGVPSKCWALK